MPIARIRPSYNPGQMPSAPQQQYISDNKEMYGKVAQQIGNDVIDFGMMLNRQAEIKQKQDDAIETETVMNSFKAAKNDILAKVLLTKSEQAIGATDTAKEELTKLETDTIGNLQNKRISVNLKNKMDEHVNASINQVTEHEYNQKEIYKDTLFTTAINDGIQAVGTAPKKEQAIDEQVSKLISTGLTMGIPESRIALKVKDAEQKYYKEAISDLMGNPQTKDQAISLLGVADRKSTRLNSSHLRRSRMPSSA